MHDLRGSYACVLFHQFNFDDYFICCQIILLMMLYATNNAFGKANVIMIGDEELEQVHEELSIAHYWHYGSLLVEKGIFDTIYLTFVHCILLMMPIQCLGLYDSVLIYDDFMVSHSYIIVVMIVRSCYVASLVHFLLLIDIFHS